MKRSDASVGTHPCYAEGVLRCRVVKRPMYLCTVHVSNGVSEGGGSSVEATSSSDLPYGAEVTYRRTLIDYNKKKGIYARWADSCFGTAHDPRPSQVGVFWGTKKWIQDSGLSHIFNRREPFTSSAFPTEIRKAIAPSHPPAMKARHDRFIGARMSTLE